MINKISSKIEVNPENVPTSAHIRPHLGKKEIFMANNYVPSRDPYDPRSRPPRSRERRPRGAGNALPEGAWNDDCGKMHIPVNRTGSRGNDLTYYCPACRKNHIHGIGAPPDLSRDHPRISHCFRGPLVGVHLTLILENPNVVYLKPLRKSK